MASPNLVIGYHKLDTKFFTDHVQHTTFHSDASQGRRRVKEVKNWYRDREIGRGTFGTVFLERSERGECRAVKEIAKDKGSLIKIDYRRELMAMAILAKHDALFVQLFGWYENDNYIHIAMEYISHGHLRNYLEVERSESEAKVITRQLLEGLVVIHQEGFAHRDLKPENIFVVSPSPVWVKIGDFGLAKLVRDGTAFRTQAFSRDYIAPEMGINTSRETSEYTNAVDIWAVGCIAHEMLARVPPFKNLVELCSYCTRPEFPRDSMLLKNISEKGMEIVESMLALRPELRITAQEALDSEWLRLEDKGQEGPEAKAGTTLPGVPAPSGAEVAEPRGEEYRFRRPSTDLPQEWSRFVGSSDNDRARTSAPPAVGEGEGGGDRDGSVSARVTPVQRQNTGESTGHKKAVRRRRITRACEPCRRRKIKCGGERPSCGACVVYGRDCLGYDPIPKPLPRPISQQPAALQPAPAPGSFISSSFLPVSTTSSYAISNSSDGGYNYAPTASPTGSSPASSGNYGWHTPTDPAPEIASLVNPLGFATAPVSSPGSNASSNAGEISRRSSTNSLYSLSAGHPGNSASDQRLQELPATFQCTFCPKRFTRAYHLRSHLRSHTGERPFVCTFCGKAFVRQHDRRRHERVHSREKKFVCRGSLKAGGTWGCGRRFAQVDALGRHFHGEAGRVCIRPLLEEETAERQRNQMLAQGQVLGPTMGQLSSNSDAPGMPLGIKVDSVHGGMVPPSVLLEQYPALASMAWGSLSPGTDELGDGGDGSNKDPVHGGMVAPSGLLEQYPALASMVWGSLSPGADELGDGGGSNKGPVHGGIPPSALLEHYPALANIEWGSLPPGADELGDGGGSNRDPVYGGMPPPSALLEHYPALANMEWGSLLPGADELGGGGDGSDMDPVHGGMVFPSALLEQYPALANMKWGSPPDAGELGDGSDGGNMDWEH